MNPVAVNQECERLCGWQWPYGFLPEAGCPVHDVPAPRDGRRWDDWPRRIPYFYVMIAGRPHGPYFLN